MPENNTINSRLIYSILTCQLRLRQSGTISYLNNLLFREFYSCTLRTMRLTFRMSFIPISLSFLKPLRWFMFISHSTFMRCILYIINLRSSKQMVWSNAEWIITVVTNIHSFWDTSMSKFIRYTMGKEVFPINSKTSITMTSFPASPIPTPICLSDIRPKASNIYYRIFHNYIVAYIGAYIKEGNYVTVS